MLDFWTKTSGTWINVLTVLVGTMLGLGLRSRLPSSIQQTITQGVGLLTLWLGFKMANQLSIVQAGRLDGVVVGLLTLTIGGVLGEWWQLEHRLNQLGEWLKRRLQGQGKFAEGFVATSLLFCVGPMTLLGSLNNGLTGDNSLLVLKSVMDGITAIAFSSSYGAGVGVSSLVILLYQGGLSLAAGTLAATIADPATDPRVGLITGVGGLMILGLGLNLLQVAKVRVASFLPAIGLAPLLYELIKRLS